MPRRESRKREGGGERDRNKHGDTSSSLPEQIDPASSEITTSGLERPPSSPLVTGGLNGCARSEVCKGHERGGSGACGATEGVVAAPVGSRNEQTKPRCVV